MKNMAITKMILFCPLKGEFFSLQSQQEALVIKLSLGHYPPHVYLLFPFFVYTINMKMEPNVCNTS